MAMVKLQFKCESWVQALHVIKICIRENVDDFLLYCDFMRNFSDTNKNIIKIYSVNLSSSLTSSTEICVQKFISILNFTMFQLIKKKHLSEVILKALSILNALAEFVAPKIHYKYLHIPHVKTLLRSYVYNYHISESIYFQSMQLVVNILRLNIVFFAPELFDIVNLSIQSRIKSAIECRALQADASTYNIMIEALKSLIEYPKIRAIVIEKLNVSDVNKFMNVIGTTIRDNKSRGVSNTDCITLLESAAEFFLLLYVPSMCTGEDSLMFVENILDLVYEQIVAHDNDSMISHDSCNFDESVNNKVNLIRT